MGDVSGKRRLQEEEEGLRVQRSQQQRNRTGQEKTKKDRAKRASCRAQEDAAVSEERLKALQDLEQ
jgi:hypothetical protein